MTITNIHKPKWLEQVLENVLLEKYGIVKDKTFAYILSLSSH